MHRLTRRLIGVWAFFGIFLLICLFMGIFAPPELVDDGEASIALTDAAGVQTVMRVDLAETPDEWQTGLMNRATVERGMLFVFSDESPRSFWMKNTLVPLDISFFRADGSWVSSARMEPCVEDPCPTTPSAAPAMFALELPTGSIGSAIGEGWSMELRR